jgi:hypothetical protein
MVKLDYKIQDCQVHKKRIYYLSSNAFAQESQCWDCCKEANDKKFRQEMARLREKEKLSEDEGESATDIISPLEG